MNDSYDSYPDTLAHVKRVQSLIANVMTSLRKRAQVHDLSKFHSPEKEAFDALGQRRRGIVYGSPEYFAQFDFPGMREAVEHHYRQNPHHPEHGAFLPDGTLDKEAVKDGTAVSRMSLLDLIEMVADWRAASERYKDGSIEDSIDHNTERFGLSPQLASIIRNTVREMGW